MANNSIEKMAMARTIYKHLYDEESKRIFKARWDFFLETDVLSYQRTMMEGKKCWDSKDFMQFVETKEAKDKIVIWGAGLCGKLALNDLRCLGLVPKFFIDNDESKIGRCIKEIPIISFVELQTLCRDAIIIVAVRKKFRDSILEQIKFHSMFVDPDFDFSNVYIPLLEHLWVQCGWQYFDFFDPIEDEIFIDAGCLNGQTSKDFISWSKGKYKRIIAFEPDSRNYQLCVSALENYHDIELINAACWSENTQLRFEECEMRGASRVSEKGNLMQACSIDSVIGDGGGGVFIKMDIEGAELEALVGSQQTIAKYKPRMAISIYHKLDDFLTIPLFIKELNSEYRFALRNYTNSLGETILYVW